MSKNIENHDSVLLLQDCIAGCKMALESMDDIREHTDDKQLRELIDKYYDEHTDKVRLSIFRIQSGCFSNSSLLVFDISGSIQIPNFI